MVKYAGFWRRFAAYLLDCLILSPLYFFIVSILFLKFGVFIIAIVEVLAVWLYFSLMESSYLQATVGKLVLSIKVVDYNYRKISFLRATGRNFAKVLSAVILMIGFIMAAFTKKKQGLHDLIAETLVVKR